MTTTTRIRIVGADAADIASHVRACIRPSSTWTEVQAMRECDHGCKLHTRQRGAITQYALLHSHAYGCQLGRSPQTREVPVSVAPRAAA